MKPVKFSIIIEIREEIKLVSKFLGIFNNSKDFDVKGEQLYFKEIKSIPIPHIIVARFIKILEEIKNNKNDCKIIEIKF